MLENMDIVVRTQMVCLVLLTFHKLRIKVLFSKMKLLVSRIKLLFLKTKLLFIESERAADFICAVF